MEEVVDKQQLGHNNNKVKEEQHLSGAYIRSLVKQLTSSRTKVSQTDHHSDTSTHVVDDGDGDGFSRSHQNLTKFGEGQQQQRVLQQQQQQQQQQNKKQVRRRLHTSRPYQERLLNMAEARREIVTALKFHRAAMKQAANEQQQQQQQQQKPPRPSPSPQQQEQTQLLQPHHDHQQSLLSLHQGGNIKSRRNPKICQSSNNFSNCLNNNNNNDTNISSSYLNLCSSSSPNPYFSWWPPASQIAPPDISSENLNSLALPNQTLGLNLNFGDFNNLDANLYHNNSPPSIYSSSLSPSSSSSSPSPNIHNNSVVTHDHPATSVTILQQGTHQLSPPMVAAGDINVAEYYSSNSSSSMMTSTGSGEGLGLGLHPVMDDEEMEEIRSIGEQHQMEWNDTLNLVTSAWWFKFLNTTKFGPQEEEEEENKSDHHPFDQVMEFPPWLNLNDTCLLHQHYYSDHHCLDDDYSHDPALPRMEIGEIEGMDGEWLA